MSNAFNKAEEIARKYTFHKQSCTLGASNLYGEFCSCDIVKRRQDLYDEICEIIMKERASHE